VLGGEWRVEWSCCRFGPVAVLGLWHLAFGTSIREVSGSRIGSDVVVTMQVEMLKESNQGMEASER